MQETLKQRPLMKNETTPKHKGIENEGDPINRKLRTASLPKLALPT
jgi:hypothetical protein